MGNVIRLLEMLQPAHEPSTLKLEITPPDQKPKGAIKRKKGSSRLYVSFYYHGRRVEKSTGLEDTAENQKLVREWLNRNLQRIDDGTFRFAAAFPSAPEEEKILFSRLEGSDFHPEAKDVLFGEFTKKWMTDVLSRERSEGKKRDYREIIRCHLLPWFESFTFAQINGVLLVKFIRDLQDRKGKYGGGLSANRIRNILIPLRSIWDDACEEHSWDLRDPFGHLKRKGKGGKIIQKRRKNVPEIFRFSEWERIVEAINPHYRPVIELQIMTGMIASELAGLRRQDIDGRFIHVRNSIVRGTEKGDLKTDYRRREIPVTKEIRKRLDVLLTRATGDHLITMKQTGTPFNASSFREGVWVTACKAADVPYRKPYAIRHTFAAWSLMMGMLPTRLVHLMGHGSKQMVFETYGTYVLGVEDDIGRMGEYFGEDFHGAPSGTQ